MSIAVLRPEFERAVDNLERQVDSGREEILDAVRDLKQSMNGQFLAQGTLLTDHHARLHTLEDRGDRDIGARVGAGVAAFIAVITAAMAVLK